MSPVAYFCYHRKDDNVLETCINSLRLVCPDVLIIIVTDGIPDELRERFKKEYKVLWLIVKPERMIKRRATCKIEELYGVISNLVDETQLLVSDVDVYFNKNPFTPFEQYKDMDLGLTTRGHEHPFPINGGIFYIRVNQKMRWWIDWHNCEIHKPTWEPYVKCRKRFGHEKYGLDWSVGQDFLIANWKNKEMILQQYGIKIVDVGPKYNYCPPTEILGSSAFELVWNALNDGEVVTVHFKSKLKQIIYQKGFPNAKLNYPKGQLSWL